jgi:Eukaryotic aspartyl protease
MDSVDTVNGNVNFDLFNLYNSAYIATIYLGEPKQPMRVLFDTGSSYTWILSKEAAEPHGYDNYYVKEDSSAFVDPNINLFVGI